MQNTRKTVLITGASRGIGRATALLFAKENYNVLINYISSKQKAEELASLIKSQGGFASSYKADVSKFSQVKDMIDYTIKTFGKIDVLINNAGIAQEKLFLDTTEEDYDNMMNINLKGTFNTIKCALPFMTKQKSGKIINISSIWGMVGSSCEVLYSGAKAGVIGLTKALAKELAVWNIQVNAVAPGAVNTDMNNDFTGTELIELTKQIPEGRIAEPEEIAEVIAFLASDKCSYMTGQVISPNGGFVII